MACQAVFLHCTLAHPHRTRYGLARTGEVSTAAHSPEKDPPKVSDPAAEEQG